MAVPLFHAGCFQPIGGEQLAGYSRRWSERSVQAQFAQDAHRDNPLGPYVILVSGTTDAVEALQRVLKPARASERRMDRTNACWDFSHPEDAKCAYYMLVSTNSVTMWLYVKSEFAHEFGDTFLRPAA